MRNRWGRVRDNGKGDLPKFVYLLLPMIILLRLLSPSRSFPFRTITSACSYSVPVPLERRRSPPFGTPRSYLGYPSMFTGLTPEDPRTGLG